MTIYMHIYMCIYIYLNNHMNTYLTSFVLGKMQIKSTVRYHFTSTRMTMIQRQIITSVDKYVEKMEFSYIAVGDVKWCNHFGKAVWQFLKKLTINLSHDSAILFLGIYTQENWKHISTQKFVHRCSPQFYSKQKVKTIKTSINQWMNKQNVTYSYNGVLPSQTKKWNTDLCYNMNELWHVMLNERSQTQRSHLVWLYKVFRKGKSIEI